MVSDQGRYPRGMVDGQTMLTYCRAPDAVQQIEALLDDPARLTVLARAGNEMVRTRYSKAQQWLDFQKLVASL
jgi:hypothetical protein